ncbi:hypothetical protein L6164_020777 [Bauhinia variegata]|uniref:Uncharacterized protein n=1 Tax=Bauhinia variegata TaxID=167791 RepID=A0ACB9MWC2_BAUVA|nr:hypothetical protein L6164_020777 [Bauhinia variegata]
METSLPLATDSFSHSWLSNSKHPLGGLGEPPRDSLHSCYGETSKEFKFCMEESRSQNFNFDFSVTQSPAAAVAHADELFCDGLIRPVFVEPSKGEFCSTPDATQTRPRFSLSSSPALTQTLQIHGGFLTKMTRSTRRTLKDLVKCLSQFRHRVGFSRKSTRVDDFDKTELQLERWSSSMPASPKPVLAYSVRDLHDHENPIYEAVLHCKRSIGSSAEK